VQTWNAAGGEPNPGVETPPQDGGYALRREGSCRAESIHNLFREAPSFNALSNLHTFNHDALHLIYLRVEQNSTRYSVPSVRSNNSNPFKRKRTRRLPIMSIPGLSSLPGLNLANSALEPPPQTVSLPRVYNLNPETELRFESSFTAPVSIKLVHGSAELFGTELAPNTVYILKGAKAAVFTWQGCRVELTGTTEAEYLAEETPMIQYMNTHFGLENARVEAQQRHTTGPRVLVVGPENSGKTSLVKMLTAYAVKSERQPVVVNLDPQQALLSVPGALTATTFASLLDVEEGWGSSPISGPSALPVKMPLCYHFGCRTAEANGKLYKSLVTRLALAVTSRMQADEEVKSSGCIIDTPGSISAGKNNNWELIQHIVSEFSGTP
jgi:polyribonucleotide 5'-hydroxyl-kinase